MKSEIGSVVNAKGQTVKVCSQAARCKTCGTDNAARAVVVSWGAVIDCELTAEEARHVATLLRAAANSADVQ